MDECPDTSGQLSWVRAPGDEVFKRAHYKLRVNASFAMDKTIPPDGWRPSKDGRPLGKRAPQDWTHYYYGKYPNRFEPVTVFKNIVQLCNLAEVEPSCRTECYEMVEEFVELTHHNSRVFDGARFVLQGYEFPRRGYSLAPGWVSSLNNAFIIRALCRYYSCNRRSRIARLLDEFAQAFTMVNTHRRPRSRPWFTFIDPDGYLWFDEYPGDDGIPTLVLNGHIHSLYGLMEYRRCRRGGAWVEDFVQGAIATMRMNAQRFRRPGRINRYSLREEGKPDYMPRRTIRQQTELARLTGDAWFSRMAMLFQRDHARACGGVKGTAAFASPLSLAGCSAGPLQT